MIKSNVPEKLETASIDQLLVVYQRLSDDYYDARFDLRYLGSSGDLVTQLDRQRMAVTIALGTKMTEEIDRQAGEKFDRRCKEAEEEGR